jgi:pimeloyl-ACP methyl ester carboxylesterase
MFRSMRSTTARFLPPVILVPASSTNDYRIEAPRSTVANWPDLNSAPSRTRLLRSSRLIWIALCSLTIAPAWCFAQTPLTNTPVTEAQIAHLFTSRTTPVLYYCQTGIFDDLGNLDGDWDQPASPGRITSAAWDIGGNRYLYAYQLSNPNNLDENVPYLGAWDVAIFGHSTLRIPLRHKNIVPVDYDGDQTLDTSFRLTDHACSSIYEAGNECTPLTGPLSVFTTGTEPCSRSWSDYYREYQGGVSNDEIVDAFVSFAPAGLHAEFAVEFDPLCCAHGIVASTQVFGFVTDAPPAYVDGLYLGGASVPIRIVGPVPHALLVHGICEDESIWSAFSQALIDSGYVVDLIHYPSLPFSGPPNQYVPALEAALNDIPSDKVAVVAHSMGGLIARDYMMRQTEMGSPEFPQKIAQLVTLGTPHHGTDLGRKLKDGLNLTDAAFHAMFPNLPWDFAPNLSKWISDCQGDRRSAQAINDQLPGSDYLNQLNYREESASYENPLTCTGWGPHPSEVLDGSAYYASIGGTASTCLFTDLLIWDGASYHLNDGVVAAESAILSNAAAFRAQDLALPTAPVTHTSTPAEVFCEVPYYELSALGATVARILLTSPAIPPVGALAPSLGHVVLDCPHSSAHWL